MRAGERRDFPNFSQRETGNDDSGTHHEAETYAERIDEERVTSRYGNRRIVQEKG